MRTLTSASTSRYSANGALFALLAATFLLLASPAFAAELDIEFESVARSGETPIPGGSGYFTGFGNVPAVDSEGNVVFTGTGNAANGQTFQSGIYTSIDICCQKVADRSTLVPGGGGATFDVFRGADRNDIDSGRVAFVADVSASSTLLGVYTNVGQASSNSLVEVALADGTEWSIVSDPWVDGSEVAMRGTRVQPEQQNVFLMWNGTEQYADPGSGYIVSPGTQAAISDGVAVFRRYQPGSSQLGVYENGFYDALVTLNSTPVPGQSGVVFSNVNNFPVVDKGGLDVAFRGNANGGLMGVYKRADGGALQQVADNDMLVPGGVPIPGWSDQYFTFFFEDGIALAGGQVAFAGEGLNALTGIYTDIGGELNVIVDNEAFSTILLDGVPEQVTQFFMGPKALSLTPWGYMLVFKATLASGEHVVIRATINEGSASDPTDSFTVHKDYSDNNSDAVSVALSCTSGTVTNSPQWASEGNPAEFTIEGASANATCTATETSVAEGYAKDEAGCQNRALNSSCTIVNTLIPPSQDTFTVYKDYSDDNSDQVLIALNCGSGSIVDSTLWASEGSPAVFTIEGASVGATCTATESSVATGYTKDESGCQNRALNSSCTIVNTLIPPSQDAFTVYKDYSDNNSDAVSVALTCSSGTVTNSPQWASEGNPAEFNIEGASANATCTATETSVAEGYAKDESGCQNRVLNSSCTIVNTLIPPSQDAFTVFKDYSDNNSDAVSVALTCSSGTVTNSPQWASEGNPAEFNIEGASANATCTATETSVAAGYTKDESGCQNRALNSSCTIVNTLIPPSQDSFTVYKDFSDNSTDSVSISLNCSSGTVTNNPQWASEGTPAEFAIEGAQPNATCMASEGSAPAGYSKDESDCQDGDPLNGSCTIVNTLDAPSSESFTVYKVYSDNTKTYVNIHLSCTGGTVTSTPRLARPGKPAVFEVVDAPAGTTCTASEPWVPDGYTKDESDCQDGDPVGGSCTVYNNESSGSVDSFTVHKDFSDNSADSVSVSLSCSSGTVTNNPQWASEGTPAEFTIEDAQPNATCTATEGSAPAGYSKDESDCQDGDPLNGSCTIVNTKEVTTDTFTVHKDFSDDSAGSVSISLSCSSGTVTNNPQWASEGTPAEFIIEDAQPNATCTATEGTVPTGYTKDESGCQDGDPLNGSCTIVNIAESGTDTFVVYKDFGDDNPASVSISLVCTSGTVTNSPSLASEGAPAIFEIEGASPGTICEAIELNVPSGYVADESQCQDGDVLNSSCTIVNTVDSGSGEDMISASGFETGQTEGWQLQNAYLSSEVAIGNYSLAHSDKEASSQRSVSTVGYENVSVTMNVAADSLEKRDSCIAELSVDGGQGWLPVMILEDRDDTRRFKSGTISPPGASNNPDLRLRFRLAGNGKGDYCWGDDVKVMGTPIGASKSASVGATAGLRVVVEDPVESAVADPYPYRGFDPGFDALIGNGEVKRSNLTWLELASGELSRSIHSENAFGLPAGARPSDHVFEGLLDAHGAGLPAFEVGLQQIGNHLYPLERGPSMDRHGGWDFIVGSGRVWSENGDRGLSRASIPFTVINLETGCAERGAMTLLFSEDGTTSRAAFQINGACEGVPFDRSGMLDVQYTPVAMNAHELAIDTALDCAAETWLPLAEGRGEFSLVLMPDGSRDYLLRDDRSNLRLSAEEKSSALKSLCD